MKPTQRRILYAFLLVAVVIAIIGLILIKGPLAPTPVQTARLQKGDLAPAVFGIGTVEARRSYALGFTRAGRLATLEADEGDRVQAEQQLGSLDPVDLPQRIRSASAMVRKTEKLVNAAESALREARARHQQARREMLRYQELARAKQVSQDIAENRASEAMAALQKVHEAEANLEAIKLDNERARADLQALKVQLQELSLVSPAEGIVSARKLEPGSVVSPGVAVLELVDPKSFWVRVRIDQAQSGAIRLDQQADIELRHLPGEPLAGRVRRVEMNADSLTEERIVDVGFERIPDNLSLGMLAHVTIRLPGIEQADWLPAAAIVYRQGKPGVWRIEGDKVHFTPLHIGIHTLDGKVQVLEGLSPQDEVALYPKKPLEEETRIHVDQRNAS